MNGTPENSTSGAPPSNNLEEDDFFGDQFSSTAEVERQAREVEALRRRHMIAGIREGSSAAQDVHVQQGFDEGFVAGANASAEASFLYVILGTLGIVRRIPCFTTMGHELFSLTARVECGVMDG